MIRIMLLSPLQPDKIDVDFYFDDNIPRKELEFAINDKVVRRIRRRRKHRLEIYVVYYGEKGGKKAAGEAVVSSSQELVVILRAVMGATAKFLDKLGVVA